MDMITLAAAKAYSDSQRRGYMETKLAPGVLTFCGDTTGQETIDIGDGMGLVKMLDRPIAESEIDSVTVVYISDGQPESHTLKKDELVIIDQEGLLLVGVPGGSQVVISVSQDYTEGDAIIPVGTWGVYREEGGVSTFVSEIHGVLMETETIDPKYLPGAVLPVVEITTEATAEGARLTDAEVAALQALAGSCCIIKTTLNGLPAQAVALCGDNGDGTYLYMVSVGTDVYMFGNYGGMYIAVIMPA